MDLLNEAVLTTPVSERGARLYVEHCASCHGKGAWGQEIGVIPALAGQREMYLLKQFVDFVELERDAPEMHRLMARKDLASPQSWRDLAAWLSDLPVNHSPQVGDGRSLTSGKRVYKKVCIECHGPTGEGDVTGAIPALRGQHYSYLVLQLRAFAGVHRIDMELPVLEYIAGLSIDELEGVADYASRLPVGDAEKLAQNCVNSAY